MDVPNASAGREVPVRAGRRTPIPEPALGASMIFLGVYSRSRAFPRKEKPGFLEKPGFWNRLLHQASPQRPKGRPCWRSGLA